MLRGKQSPKHRSLAAVSAQSAPRSIELLGIRIDCIRREELILLKVGRHFRLTPAVKIIVARDEAENRFLSRYEDRGWRFEALHCGSPLTLTEGEPDEETRRLIASITARYSDRRAEPLVEVAARRVGREELFLVPPVADQVLETCRI